jgi:hypothetical protein
MLTAISSPLLYCARSSFTCSSAFFSSDRETAPRPITQN